MSNRAPKILCLCGYLQNGKVFSEKSSGIRKILTKKHNFTLDYIDPPIIIERKEDLPFSLSLDEEEAKSRWDNIVNLDVNRCWWSHKSDGVYEGFEQSLEYVINHIKTQGPYDGIIGFSQGAALSAIVTNKLKTLIPDHPDFKISLLISGFTFTETLNGEDNSIVNQTEDFDEYKSKVKLIPHFHKYFEPPSDLKTRLVFVNGSEDQTVPRVRALLLQSLYPDESSTEFVHDGAHYVPNKKQFLNPIVEEFLSACDLKSNL